MTPDPSSFFPEPLSDDAPLLFREAGEKAYLLLNRPARCNAFSLPLLEEFRRRLIFLEERNDLRVLLIAGAGNHFSSGLDLREAASKKTLAVDISSDSFPLTDALKKSLFELFPRGEKRGTLEVPQGFRMPWLVVEILLRLAALPQVVIGIGRGGAFGGGGALLASCDIVPAEPSVRFGFPECRRGIVPTLLHPFLERRVPLRGLLPSLLTGRGIGAAEAIRLGLVDEAADEGEGETWAEEAADEVLTGAPERVRRTKELFRAPTRDLVERSAVGLLRHWESWNEPTAAEGIAAFLEKRDPRW
ncbi:MAG: enoyl-CoA hydratase/isomerase family protein [Thermoguttaceae bacterium]|nr:enoyl-CoA hydratase/isomerase family protein [Thermoguttaceae bacterium]